MAQNLANLALDGGDPRVSSEKNPGQFALDNGHEDGLKNGFTIEKAQVHNDPSVLFEEYLHYAEITRAEERAYEGNAINRKAPWSLGGVIKNRFSKGHVHEVNAVVGEDTIVTTHNNTSTVTDLEWRQASRALRTASWGSIFFLITTDILGPSGAAYVFSAQPTAPNSSWLRVFHKDANTSLDGLSQIQDSVPVSLFTQYLALWPLSPGGTCGVSTCIWTPTATHYEISDRPSFESSVPR